MLINLLSEQVRRFPDQLAVKTESTSLTYKELDQESNQVAAKILDLYDTLQNQSDHIALLFEHGPAMIIATIAAIKAGKIYVPCDLSYPENRLLKMLEDAEVQIVVTTSKNKDKAYRLIELAGGELNLIFIDQIVGDFDLEPVNHSREDGLLYVLYTSGSTGQPKGVIQNQSNVLHFIKNYGRKLGINPGDRLTLFSTFGHDAAVMDIYSGLLHGATLYPLNIKENNALHKLTDWLVEEGITIWHSVPTLFRAFLTTLKGSEKFAGIRYIVLGGEAVREHDVEMFKRYFPTAILMNLYGQSESSYNSSFCIDKDTDFSKVLLGEPIDGVTMLLIDEKGKKVAPLRTGEIVIASDHVALGYWKKELETKNAFTNHPKLGKLYWTGDLGRQTLDGNIEFLGRKDFQVKIRGYRVETGDVESYLLKCAGITETVVMGREDQNEEMHLCAYYVADGKISNQELRELLSKELPEQMIPTHFFAMESLPLTGTGKVDRGALPDLTSLVKKVEYIEPRTPAEEALVEVWAELLGLERVGIDDDFFNLGGHSLKATILLAKIYEKMGVELSLTEIFQYSTIRTLAERIERMDNHHGRSVHFDSLKPVEEKPYYDVSSAQRRMYVLHQLEKENTSYNMPKTLLVQGNLNVLRVEETIRALIKRHETLRTSFDEKDGKIIQIVHTEVELPFTYIEDIHAEEVLPKIIKEFLRPFNLRKAPIFRVQLVRFSDERHAVLFDMHHIIFDGTSMDILIRDFIKLYEGDELPELPVQYKDYAVWQNELLVSGFLESQKEYWLQVFKTRPPVLNMPTDFQRPPHQSFAGQRVGIEVDKGLTEGLKRLAQRTRSTLYMVLLAAYNTLLFKYTGQEDIVIGSPIAGRPHLDLQQIIGMFLNTLAMRNYPTADKTFTDFLHEVKGNTLQAFENQEYQFEELVKELNLSRDLARNPLFDTMIILQNYLDTSLDISSKIISNSASNTSFDLAQTTFRNSGQTIPEEFSVRDLTFTTYSFENLVSKLDMTLIAEEWDGKLRLTMEYCTKLFTQETMERFLAHYLQVLRKVVQNPEINLAKVDLITTFETEQLLQQFNQTKLNYPADKTIHQIFAEQVQKTPDQKAVVFQDKELSYVELDRRAHHVAQMLQKKGVQPDSVVPIMLRRSLEMMIGILGILKSGAAYLPIDPEYPVERIKYICDDSRAQIVLTDEKLFPVLEDLPIEAIRLDTEELYQGQEENLTSLVSPENLAYVIYTSGSTGKPKGVMIEHRSVVNLIQGIVEKIEFTPAKKILALTTISFDISVLETLLPLTQGTTVVIANDEEQRDTNALYRVIMKNNVQMVQMTPSRLQMLLNDDVNVSCLQNLHELLIGGEALPLSVLQEVKGHTQGRIYNMYGPTETTIWSTMQELTMVNQVTIGRPIANTGVYILGRENQLQPIGIPGELCITGVGLARGYWNRDELTRASFVKNPFSRANSELNNTELMYRTGDMARWLRNDELEYLGRIDDQIKIRGFRIEPGEIENQLLQNPDITAAVVVPKTDTIGGQYLCAYFTGKEKLHIPEIRVQLAKMLPDYMIPTFFIQLEELPYTPNGKIHRGALPEPDANLVTGVQYVPPTTEIEAKLIKIWEEVLGIDGIGVRHNFFEVGGNSINIIKVISLISKRMGITIPMGELFMKPTVEELAENLFGNPLEGFEHVVRLNKPAKGKKNVFIIHTWEGIIYQYKELAKLLEGEYNIFGIQAKGILKPAKLPETLDEMITDYICEIKALQPEGPYIIAGYCYGNWIAYRIVQELEYYCVPVERLIQIDENAFIPVKGRKFYRAKTELSRPYLLARKLWSKLILRNRNPMDHWPDLDEYRKSKPPIQGEIRNAMSVRDNVNRLCTVGYRLNYLISTDVYVIKAEENKSVRYTPDDWKKQTDGQVWFEEIPGGHETLFNYPYVEEFARMFKRALEE